MAGLFCGCGGEVPANSYTQAAALRRQHSGMARPNARRTMRGMDHFDKRMALEVVEDALGDIDTPYGRGLVAVLLVV